MNWGMATALAMTAPPTAPARTATLFESTIARAQFHTQYSGVSVVNQFRIEALDGSQPHPCECIATGRVCECGKSGHVARSEGRNSV